MYYKIQKCLKEAAFIHFCLFSEALKLFEEKLKNQKKLTVILFVHIFYTQKAEMVLFHLQS